MLIKFQLEEQEVSPRVRGASHQAKGCKLNWRRPFLRASAVMLISWSRALIHHAAARANVINGCRPERRIILTRVQHGKFNDSSRQMKPRQKVNQEDGVTRTTSDVSLLRTENQIRAAANGHADWIWINQSFNSSHCRRMSLQ